MGILDIEIGIFVLREPSWARLVHGNDDMTSSPIAKLEGDQDERHRV